MTLFLLGYESSPSMSQVRDHKNWAGVRTRDESWLKSSNPVSEYHTAELVFLLKLLLPQLSTPNPTTLAGDSTVTLIETHGYRDETVTVGP